MAAIPLRSYSYGPDFSNSDDMFTSKKRKRVFDGEDSLRLGTLPVRATPALSDASSEPGELPPLLPDEQQLMQHQQQQYQQQFQQHQQTPFIFSSPTPTIFHSPRKLANPHKRTHFNRPSITTLASSPVIPPTPALTFSSDSLSQLSQLNASTQACHLCQHRPANVQDLSSYVDCESCRQRTCSVCTRVCEGPRCRPSISARQTLFSGATPRTAPEGDLPRGKIVCRGCCVEVGVDGHIWCTACYADDTELENFALGKNKKALEQESLGRVASWLQDCGPDDMITEEPDMDTDIHGTWMS